MSRKFQSQGVVFLGMTSQSTKELPEIQRFVEETGISWPSAYGARQTIADFKVEGIPATWVIGVDGKVVWDSGERTKLEDAIARALKDAG